MMFQSLANEQIFALGISLGTTVGLFIGFWAAKNEIKQLKEAKS